MNSQLVIILIIASTVSGAEWTEWTETPDSTCSEDCGMCGTRVTANRTCPTPGECEGDSEQTEKCPPKLCLFPKRTCCKGYIKGFVDNRLKCVEKVRVSTTESTTDYSTTGETSTTDRSTTV